MEILIFWFVLSAIIAVAGEKRKIGFWGAFFLSFLLSPLIGLIGLLMSDKLPDPKEEEAKRRALQAAAQGSIPDQLAKLKSLADAGAITAEEYASAKEKLLKQM
jgi:hypothetical protein